ncbi:hypothetical protein [Streptomyces sp. NPDC014623]|uniref:hypothetical protein n=1 Tax=Streptomyces sp. NPDC014623 TaxID=3364875 RepID=UPI0036F935FF
MTGIIHPDVFHGPPVHASVLDSRRHHLPDPALSRIEELVSPAGARVGPDEAVDRDPEDDEARHVTVGA